MTLEWSWQRPHHCRPCGGCCHCWGSVMALLWSSLSLSQHTGAQHGSETCTLSPRHPSIPPCSMPMSHQGLCPASIEGPDLVVLGRLLCAHMALPPVSSGLCQLTPLAQAGS